MSEPRPSAAYLLIGGVSWPLVKTVFRNGDVGYGSAMAVVLTAIVLGVGFVYTRLHRPGAAA